MSQLRRWIARLLPLAFGLLGTRAAWSQETQELGPVLEAAREALGQGAGPVTFQLSGTTQKNGLRARFRWTLAAEGYFLKELQGPFPESVGFDGQETWRLEGRSHSYPLVMLERERLLCSTWILSGAWCLPNSPFTIQAAANEEENTKLLQLRLSDGQIAGRLKLDAESWLPHSFQFDEEFGGASLLFEDWQASAALHLPHRITLVAPSAAPQVFEVQTAGVWTRKQPSYGPAEREERSLRDSQFIPELPAQLEVRRSASGQAFVRPLVDGKRLGWFLFDSRRGTSILTRSCAQQLGLKSFGETLVSGSDGPARPAVFLQGHRLQLGPLLIDGPVFIEQQDLPQADSMLAGEKCAGALGWDVFLRALVELNPGAGSIRLHDPLAFEAEGLSWQPLALHRHAPYMHASFAPDREGWFCFDTGAGPLTALFHFSATARLGLLAEGAKGDYSLQTKRLEWFELAGHRHGPAEVKLSTRADGESDPYALGFLGLGFLGGERVLFDYSRSRFACAPVD